MEFLGYVRENGKVGARNHVAVIPSVNCSNEVAKRICIEVENTRPFNHHQGCCQLPPDLDCTTKTLTALGINPNVGAALIVSLGCEGTDVDYMAQEITKTGKPVEVIRIQEMGGTRKAVEGGICKATQLADRIAGAMGLLDSRVGDGTYVKEFSYCDYMGRVSDFYLGPELLDKICEYRNVIEIESARLAILRATSEEIAELEAICQNFEI